MRNSLRTALLAAALTWQGLGCFAIGGGAYYAPSSQADRTPGASVVDVGSAVAGAFINRAQGGCYAGCPAGTTCNTKTGLCDELPCRGACGWNEVCLGSGLAAKCVSASYSLTVESLTEATRPRPASDRPRQVRLRPQVEPAGILPPGAVEPTPGSSAPHEPPATTPTEYVAPPQGLDSKAREPSAPAQGGTEANRSR